MHRLPLLAFIAALGGYASAQTPPPMELWYQHHSYITSAAALQSSEAIVDQAAAAGYTGLVLWDSSLGVINLPGWPAQNVALLKQFIAYAQSKGLRVMPAVFPFGYSNDVLERNPNWAEGQHITGAQFQVSANGTALTFVNSFPGLQNPGFESGTAAWFSYGDAGVSLDQSTSHTGLASALISNPPLNARLYQKFNVTPWRQYHFRVWAKTNNLTSQPNVFISDANDFNAQRLNAPLGVSATQGWTAYDWTINSGPGTSLSILMGIWGGASGQIWFDDILLEETALVYVLRRPGTPLKVYNPANPSVVYTENVDYNYISEPKFATNPSFNNDNWHTPVVPSIPSGSALKPGQTVAVDFYAVEPIYNSQVGMCLTEPAALQSVYDSTTAIIGIMPPASPYMLWYDEMRHMNSCASCKAKNMTAGQLLAWSMGQTKSYFQNASPLSPLYVWSDMFDPNQNAVNDYYLVEGTIAGSWAGLPSNITVMNWNLGNLITSLKFFAGLTPQQTTPYRQVIAGFYDPGNNDGAAAANTILQQAAGIPGVAGVMYTTWQDNYTQLGTFAAAARTAWITYQSTVKQNPGAIAGTVTDSSGRPIANAKVALGTSSAATAANGSYQLANVAAGAYSVTASAAGYTSVTSSVTVAAGAAATLNFQLKAVVNAFQPIRINAGGAAYTDSTGVTWSADSGFLDGAALSYNVPVANTPAPALYQTIRANHTSLDYAFNSIPNGNYNVKLKFASVSFASVFDIVLNGVTVLPQFNIVAAAGGPNTAIDKTFTISVTNGSIAIKLVPRVLYPQISAIEIVQAQ